MAPSADPAEAGAAARLAIAQAKARVDSLSVLAAAAGPTASAALADWLAVTVGAVQQGRQPSAEERIAAAVALRNARNVLHELGDALLVVGADLDAAASAHVAAVLAAPVKGTA